MKKYYIYLTINNINGMKYIGKHYGELNDSYLGSGTLLKRAILKYGKENFTKTILFISKDENENCEKEKYFIALHNAVDSPYYYNIHVGGMGGNTTAGYTKEEKEALRKKLSEISKGEKNGMFGKKHSEKTKALLSYWAEFERDNSIYRTEEFKKKMSEKTKGEANGMFGRKHSKESKQKMSEHSKGKTLGEKNGMFGKKDDKAINGKKIEMYDKNHNLVKVFNTKKMVLEFLNLKGHTQLNQAIKNKTLYKNHYWVQIEKD